MKQEKQFDTPILYLVFNRPDLVKITFPRIREVKPKQLFIAADGPRQNHPTDAQKCAEVREYLATAIDWDCEVYRLYRDENLGCGLAVSGAITWFFEHVEMGIILEDDILPDLSFFRFCEYNLKKFLSSTSVMHITGTSLYLFNLSKNSIVGKYANVWGWATWRHSWKLFDYHSFERDFFNEYYTYSNMEKEYWQQQKQNLISNKINSWAFRWQFSVWINRGVSISPPVNLVSNIGFGGNSTHTFVENSILANRKVSSLNRFKFNNDITIDETYDFKTFNFFYQLKPNVLWKVNKKVEKVVIYFKSIFK